MNLQDVLMRLQVIDDAGKGCDELDSLMRDLEAQLAVKYGSDALETFTEAEQSIIMEMAMDEAGDMSSKGRAWDILDEMDATEMRYWLDEANEDDYGDGKE